jgi:hypothetical protein
MPDTTDIIFLNDIAQTSLEKEPKDRITDPPSSIRQIAKHPT